MRSRLKLLRQTEEEALADLRNRKREAFKAGRVPGVFVGVDERDHSDLGEPLLRAAENLHTVTRELNRVGQVTEIAAAAISRFNEVLHETLDRTLVQSLIQRHMSEVDPEFVRAQLLNILHQLEDTGVLAPNFREWNLNITQDEVDPSLLHVSFSPPTIIDEVPLAIGPDDYNEGGE